MLFSTFLLSCQEHIIESRPEYGEISVRLENSPVVEVISKAYVGEEVPTDDFMVYVSSSNSTYSWRCADMPSVVTLPVGMYTVSAESVSAADAVSLPDRWGQVRYAGKTSEPVEVVAGATPVTVDLTCRMANTAVSVVFGENIDKHFTDYTMTAYTDASRKLVYTPENTAGEDPAVGYFDSVTLHYVFEGVFMDDSQPLKITGSKVLEPATHLHLTLRMSGQNGSLGRPDIEIDYKCEDLDEILTVDPSGDGTFM